MRTASTSIPRWIDLPLNPRCPGFTDPRPLGAPVRNCLPPLAELLDVEIVLISAEGYCVGRTGTYRGGGCKMPEDTALTYSLRSGQSTMVLSPGEDAVCRAVRAGGLHGYGEFHRPGARGQNVAVVEQGVAFTDDRRMELLMKAEKAS